MEIPDDIFIHIFQFLGKKSFAKIRTLSTYFYNISFKVNWNFSIDHVTLSNSNWINLYNIKYNVKLHSELFANEPNLPLEHIRETSIPLDPLMITKLKFAKRFDWSFIHFEFFKQLKNLKSLKLGS